jgi:hypothetical protein
MALVVAPVPVICAVTVVRWRHDFGAGWLPSPPAT